MKRTGIRATEEEIADLKAAASAPVMMVGGVSTHRDPAKLAHEIALKHGLPEIPGFYGIDLGTGEFLAADNAPLPEGGLADKVQPSARELAERVLGKAVHPQAIDRLFELEPDAEVEVEHAPAGMRPRFTVVRIGRKEGRLQLAAAEATCSPSDQFDRRRGIRLAFGRALRQLSEAA